MIANSPRPVVIYDGECSFCRAQVERIKRRDREDRIEFLPFPSPEIDQRFPHLSDMDIDAGMRFVAPDGAISVGADAAHQIALELPRWRWIAWLYHVPGVKWIAGRTYAWIARRRYRLSGTTESCKNGVCRTD